MTEVSPASPVVYENEGYRVRKLEVPSEGSSK